MLAQSAIKGPLAATQQRQSKQVQDALGQHGATVARTRSFPQFVARLLRAPPNEDWAYYFGYVARGVVDNLVLPASFLIILRWAIGWLITHKSETPAS